MAGEDKFALPAEQMFSIQVGDRLFRVSGASLSSDAPSYFTCFFAQQGNAGKTLFIDRSPLVFDKIYLHLQGYHVTISDEKEFIYLFADANYFNLRKLKTLLLEGDVFANIGGKTFRIPHSLITSPGNSPNFFTVACQSLLQDPFQIEQLKDILRPPPQAPLMNFNRSAALFEDILMGLQGYEVCIRDERHRQNLLDECKYYRLQALEQKFVNHRIRTNPFTHEEEIVMQLKDIKRQGLLHPSPKESYLDFLLRYSRPFVDEGVARDLIVQIDSTEVNLLLSKNDKLVSLTIIGKTARKLFMLLSAVSRDDLIYEEVGDSKMPKLTMLVQMVGCDCTINGRHMPADWISALLDSGCDDVFRENLLADETLYRLPPPQNLPPSVSIGDVYVVKVLKSQWSIGVRGSRIWFNGRCVEGITDDKAWHASENFI